MYEYFYLRDFRLHKISEQTALIKTTTFGVTHKGDFLGIITKTDHFLGMPVTKSRRGEIIYTAEITHADGSTETYEETELNEMFERLIESFYEEHPDGFILE